MRVMLCRTGGVIYAEGADDATPVGDTTGGAMGVIRYLRDAGHDVTVFGAVRGDIKGVEVIRPRTRGLDHLSLVRDVEAAYREAVELLAARRPELCLNVGGPIPTTSWVGNPFGSSTLQCYIKYSGPALYAMHVLGLPRVMLIHDPRNYPRDHEMLYWPECRPVAVLSLEEAEFPRRMRDQRFMIRSVLGRGENWWSYGQAPVCASGDRLTRCLMVQHSHLEDGRLSDGRADAYASFLCGAVNAIVGRGWDQYPGGAPRQWLGEVSPGECKRLLRGALCGPIVPIADKFVTSKLRQYVMNGCLPLPYGRGERFTFDHRGAYVPLDAGVRVQSQEDLRRLVDRAGTDEAWRREWVDRIYTATRPDFSVLEACMANWRSGRYGGYERCESE